MPFTTRSRLHSYGQAILSVGFALLLMLWLDPLARMTQAPFLLFFGAVVISAWQGGLQAGLVATSLSALVSTYFFFEPKYSLLIGIADNVRLLVFILECILISAICDSLLTTNQRLRRSSSELKASEDLLRTANRRITEILESITDGFYTLDQQLQFAYINTQAEQILKRSRNELLGQQIWKAFPQGRGSIFAQSFQRAITEQTPVVFESFGVVNPERWFEVHINPLHDGLAVYFQEITERKQAELELRESELRFRQLAENIHEVFWISDPIGKQVLYINPVYETVFGRSRQSLYEYTPSWMEAIHPDDRERMELAVKKIPVRAEDYNEEYRIIRPDGEVRWIHSRMFPVQNEVGETYRVVGVSEDITQRKQVELALRESEARFRLMAENIQDAFWIKDFSSLQILYVSPAYEQIWGRSRDDLYQNHSNWIKNIYPEDIETVQSVPTELISQGYVEKEYRIVRPEGEIRWIRDRGFAVRDEAGQIARFVGVAQDITERKQAEQEREELLTRERSAREQAEAANRIKDEFLAVLSHELRSPLNPILGWTKLLQTRKFDERATAKALETIERNTKLQLQLIEDLLDVSRSLLGKTILNAKPVNLSVVIESALETVLLAAEAKGIQVQKVIAEDIPPVSGDAGRLQQIVWNLLSNAVKFTPPGGQVEIRLSVVEGVGGAEGVGEWGSRGDKEDKEDISSYQSPFNSHQSTKPIQNCYAQIQVKDTGQGITPEFLPYVFDRFRQQDSKTTRQFGGLGLGLAIVRHLTELHGGTVKVESLGVNKGTTFTVTLPLMIAVGETPAIIEPHPEITNLSGLRILAVDDEADARDLLAAILQPYGAEVKLVASAAEVLNVLAVFKPDILISDIGMPDTDGYTLLRQVRKLLPEQVGLVPALALTAYAGEFNEQLALKAGFQAHIAKPVEPSKLIELIATLVEKNRNK